ncbi:MAG: hypothetical protein WA130_13210 [Candidatus Methanoperedens sp.]
MQQMDIVKQCFGIQITPKLQSASAIMPRSSAAVECAGATFDLKKIIILESNLDSNNDYKLKGDLHRIFWDFFWDFYYRFSIESLFVLAVNGLIIIFEFNNIEFGVILIMGSLIIFLFTSIGGHTGNRALTYLGITSTMTILGYELGYFLFYDLEKIFGIPSIIFIAGTIIICWIITAIVLYSILGISRNFSFVEIIFRLKKSFHLI